MNARIIQTNSTCYASIRTSHSSSSTCATNRITRVSSCPVAEARFSASLLCIADDSQNEAVLLLLSLLPLPSSAPSILSYHSHHRQTYAQYNRVPLELRRPFSYNHLLFRPMLSRLPVGLGVPGRLDIVESEKRDPAPDATAVDPPRVPGDPKDAFRVLWNGLAGEKGDPLRLPLEGPPLAGRALGNSGLPEMGEPVKLLLKLVSLPLPLPCVAAAMLAAEPETEGVRVYRGGVVYTALGVADVLRTGRPNSLRWLGVNGISTRVSGLRKSGRRERAMLMKSTALMTVTSRPLYCWGMNVWPLTGQSRRTESV